MRIEIELAIKHIDKIYSILDEICTDYETKTPSLNVIEEVLDKSKLKKYKGLSDAEANFYTIFNSLLNSILKACKDQCEKIGTTKLPLSVFKMFIDVTKENILYGLKTR